MYEDRAFLTRTEPSVAQKFEQRLQAANTVGEKCDILIERGQYIATRKGTWIGMEWMMEAIGASSANLSVAGTLERPPPGRKPPALSGISPSAGAPWQPKPLELVRDGKPASEIGMKRLNALWSYTVGNPRKTPRVTYHSMNAHLRNGGAIDAFDECKFLQKLIQEDAHIFEGTFYRAVDRSVAKGNLKKVLDGETATFDEMGFLSTTGTRDFAYKWAVNDPNDWLRSGPGFQDPVFLMIDGKAANLQRFDDLMTSADEYLFAAGSKFKVVERIKAKPGASGMEGYDVIRLKQIDTP